MLFTCLSSGIRTGTGSTRFACLYNMVALCLSLYQATTYLTINILNKQETLVSDLLLFFLVFPVLPSQQLCIVDNGIENSVYMPSTALILYPIK